MENRNKMLAKNTMILGIGQFIPKLISLITLPILTKYMSTESYGTYDLVLSIGSLAIPIFTLLIQQAAFRFLIDPYKDKTKTISNSLIVIALLFAFWFLIISIASLMNVYSVPVMWMVFLLYASESLYDTVGQHIRGLGSNICYSIGVVVYSVVNMLLLLVLMYLNTINAYTTILISSISYIVGFVFLCIRGRINRYINFKICSIEYIKDMLAYSLPIIPSSIALWIVNLSDRLLVIAFLGSSINGIYAVANKIPNLCGTAYSVFNLAWTENASRTADDIDRNDYYSKLFNSLFSFMVGAVSGLLIISPIVFNILIDEKFASGIYQMPPLFWGILSSCMVSFLGGIYVGLKRTKQVGVSSAVGALLNLLINFVLINKLGLFAASISTVVSFLAIFVYRIQDLKKYIDLKCDYIMMMVSFFCLSLITVLFYTNIFSMFIVGGVLCFGYNIKYNIAILKKLTSKCIRK